MPDSSPTAPPSPNFKNIVIAGGTGDIGSRLTAHLRSNGHRVTIISRTPLTAIRPAIAWDDPSLADVAAQSEILINLAGENIWSGRWSASKKQHIRQSRSDVLHRLLALANQAPGPSVFLNASGIAYYGTTASRIVEDESAPPGDGFLAQVCRENEQLVNEGVSSSVRVIHARIGVTLSRDGVALRRLVQFHRLFCPSRVGSGEQGFSWIHIDDLIALLTFVVIDPQFRGPCNAVAPVPVTFRELGKEISRRLHCPRWLCLPAPLLRLAMGEAADILLHGHKVFPHRALAAGFQFCFPTLDQALTDLLPSQETPS